MKRSRRKDMSAHALVELDAVDAALALSGGGHGRQASPGVAAGVATGPAKAQAGSPGNAGRAEGRAPAPNRTVRGASSSSAPAAASAPSSAAAGARQVERSATLDIGVAPTPIES